MSLRLELIDANMYERDCDAIFALAQKIWTRPESFENVKHSIERWGKSKTESGAYFFIKNNDDTIGLTGYFVPQPKLGIFGLRHHGTTQRGTGKPALDLLVNYIKNNYPLFNGIVELIPPGREELISKFEEWGFHLMPQGVPDWEPKKAYYKYAMIKNQ